MWRDVLFLEKEKKQKLFYSIGIILFVYIVFRYILPLIVPFLLAAGIAAVILPMVSFLKRTYHLPKIFGCVITLGGVLGITGCIAFFLIKNFFFQLRYLLQRFPIYEQMAYGQIHGVCCMCDRFFGLEVGSIERLIFHGINGMLANVQTKLIPVVTKQAWHVIWKGAIFFGNLLFLFIAVILFVQEADKIKQFYQKNYFYQELHKIKKRLSVAGISYLKVQYSLFCIIAGINILGLWILNNTYTVLLGIVIAIIDAFPILGSGLIFIPWMIDSFFSHNLMQAAVLCSMYFLGQFVRQLIEPRLLGDKIGISPIVEILTVYIGFELFGGFGFLLGPIAFLLIQCLLEDVYRI